MRGDHSTMTVERPRSAREALAALAKDPRLMPLAGGTDFMVGWNLGLFNGRGVLDLSGVKEWGRAVPERGGGLRLGALVTHAQIQRLPEIKAFSLLSRACGTVGAAQIQNRGTIGGNLANASPAGDTFPPLAVYEAVVCAASAAGRREIPILDLFAGVKRTTLAPGELIESVCLPPLPRAPSRQVFRKVGTRQAQAISKVVAAGLLWTTKKGEVEELRFAFGSVAPTVKRLRAAESYLKGKKLSSDTVEKAVELVSSDISPIDDIRSTREYRLAVARNILRAFLEGR